MALHLPQKGAGRSSYRMSCLISDGTIGGTCRKVRITAYHGNCFHLFFSTLSCVCLHAKGTTLDHIFMLGGEEKQYSWPLGQQGSSSNV